MGKYMRIAKKLQTASKQVFGVKLLIDQRQWYHKDKDTAITVYTLFQVGSGSRGGSSKIKLFQTYSQIQLVLYMRDLWYELNGWEIPTDNKVWEELKRKYGEQEQPTQDDPTIQNSEESERWRTERNRTAICNELYQGWERNRSTENDSGHCKA